MNLFFYQNVIATPKLAWVTSGIALDPLDQPISAGATFVLDGVIAPGDTDRFRAYFDQNADGFGFAIALNSPGGQGFPSSIHAVTQSA